MKIESILISDDNTNITAMTVQNTDEERKVQETVDFKMVTFSLSGKDYAIDIMYVKEIAKAGQFTYVPNTLPFVIGVYNLRGEIIPILDMRIFFNVEAKNTVSSGLQNLLILTVEEQTFGIIVDKIDKVVGIQKSTIQPPHPLFVDINIRYISGVVENNKRLYILLDIARIFSKAKDEDEVKYEARMNELKNSYEAQKSKARIEQTSPAQQVQNAVTEEAPKQPEVKPEVKPEEKQAASQSIPESTPEPVKEVKEEPVVQETVSEKPAAEEKAAPETPKAEAAEPFDEKNYGFVVEGLKNFGKFNATALNESWARHRFEEWTKERSGSAIQIQSEKDAEEFLKSFWSECSNQWWTKEYADNLFNLLPDNSAKQIIVWNPGCGNGMETYSLACVLAKRYPESKIRLYAQDVDLLSVSNAPMLTVPEDERTAWMSPFLTKTASGSNAFNQQIKDSIMFEYHDCQHTNALPMVDLIFARDLLSFLDEKAQQSVSQDFLEKLKGNGCVVLGENETVPDSGEFLEHTAGAITVFAKQ